MADCHCVMLNRQKGESQREWFKRWMCMFHWMQTDYYQNKLPPAERTWDEQAFRDSLDDELDNQTP